MEMKWLPTSAPKIVVIFPTKNEEETIENVISNTEKANMLHK
jgi:glycosyltransferase involved in cell wall biosynthesis